MTDRFQDYYQRDDLWAPDVVAPHGAVADEIIGLLPKEARSILDVGCGNGAISNAITDRLVIGSDIALAAIKHMRHPACVADISAMPFTDGSFDLVMATDVLEHIPDDQYAKACAEIERIAKRWILIAVPYRELLDSATVECAKCGILYHVHWHQRSYDESFLRDHWRGRASVARWGLAGERWIWTSQAVLDLKHAAVGRNYDFPQALCPECGTVRGPSPPPPAIEREFESLHYSLVEAGAALRPPRSEILALFDKQTKRHAVFSDPVARPRSPAELKPRELVRRENPEAYPVAPYVTDVRRDSFVLALPGLPKSIECPGVTAALFDSVAGVYQPVDLNGQEALPDASPTRFGYLLFIDSSIAACPPLKLSAEPRESRLLHSGSTGASQAVARVRAELAATSTALERRREAAEQSAVAAMRSAAVLEARVAGLERQAEQIEARRKFAEDAAQRSAAVAMESEARISVLLETSERLEAARASAELGAQERINALLGASELIESRREAAQEALEKASIVAAANEARINTLLESAERIEAARAGAESIATAAQSAANAFEQEASRLHLDLDVARQAAERADARHVALRGELDQEVAERLETAWRLRQSGQRETALQQRLVAEGSVDRPGLGDILRRYKRALVETLDWIAIRRPTRKPRPWPSQVLVLSHMYPRANSPVIGIFVHDQVKALRAQGLDVHVISGEPFWVTSFSIPRLISGMRQYFRSKATTVEYEGVPVTLFPWFVGVWVPHWAQAWTYRHGFKRIWREWAKGKNIGIVHAHTSNLDGTAGRIAADRVGAPLLLTEHMGPFSVLTSHALKRRKTRAAVRTADRVFAVSSALRQEMVRTLGAVAQRVEVLPNGVDLDLFKVAQSDAKPTATRALWIGHHVPVKRVDRLLAAFATAHARNSELTLSLLGDGELLEQAKAQAKSLGIENCVTFLPAADRASVPRHIQAHDYVVISSETETFGLVALEAMACGKPVLATACGGPQEIIVNERLGLVVENSEAGLARGLLDMARRVGIFDANQIRAHVENTGSWARVARSLTEAYVAAHDHGR